MENAGGDRDFFYKQSFGTDYFGYELIGSPNLNRAVLREGVERGIIYRSNSPWIVDAFEDCIKTKGLNIFEWMLSYSSDGVYVPERLQMRAITFVHLLIEEFFDRRGRALYGARRDVALRNYERENRRLYDRMERAMTETLAFLPK